MHSKLGVTSQGFISYGNWLYNGDMGLPHSLHGQLHYNLAHCDIQKASKKSIRLRSCSYAEYELSCSHHF